VVVYQADVTGLGPSFVLKMKLQNTGTKPVINMPVMLTYNDKLYWARRNQVPACPRPLFPASPTHDTSVVPTVTAAKMALPVTINKG
jgi:hypothetical protein